MSDTVEVYDLWSVAMELAKIHKPPFIIEPKNDERILICAEGNIPLLENMKDVDEIWTLGLDGKSIKPFKMFK